MDTTLIQQYLANIPTSGAVGEKITHASFSTKISTKDDSVVVTPTQPTEPTQKPTEKETENVTQNTVTFANSLSWSGTIYCYYWSDSNTTMTSWPGVAMTKSGKNEFGQDLYTFKVPASADKLIFTNGSNQTVDISYSGGSIKYYPTNTKTGNGYNVEIW